MADLAPQNHQRVRRNYAAMIENIDRLVGELVAYLERTGQLDDNIVIYSSDHGEMLGEHRLWEKFVPYQHRSTCRRSSSGRGVAARGPLAEPASTVDPRATLPELGGATLDQTADSRSLVPLLRGPAGPAREMAFSALGAWRLAFDGRFKLVSGYTPEQPRGAMVRSPFDRDARAPLLFDLEADPLETRALAATRPHERRRLEEVLRSWVG